MSTARTHYYSVVLLGISSGLPIALCSSTLQAWFTEENLGIILLGFINIIGLPYVLKWLWAPLLDRLTLYSLGRRKSWIVTMQLALIVVLWTMSYLHPAQNPGLLMGLGAILAFFSSTQDIAVDAYRTEILSPKDRGLGAALNVTGYRFALLIAGAMALLLADRIGWGYTYKIMALILFACSMLTFFTPEPKMLKQPTTLRDAFVGPIQDFLKRSNALWLIAVIVFYKLGEAYALSLTTPFLLRGLHFTLSEVALLNKVVGLSAIIIGGIVGGLWMMRLGLFYSLLTFGILAALSNILFVVMAIVGKNMILAGFCIFAENFCGGMSSAAFVAFLMSLCNPKFTAMQYASLSAIATVGRVLVGSTSGVLVQHLGWADFYWVSTIICIPGLYMLWRSQNLHCFRGAYNLTESV
ncbi:MAG: muropeptide transporter [Gammaproteobacteria bacterium]|jgi:PAT family beta-lactamase induction signal transducer AmpG|nr:muropeptide transporter [Gammaproteobacteria bacterium]